MDADNQLLGHAVIKLDSTQHSTVVHCTECPSWAVLCSTPQAGERIAEQHERDVHPGRSTVRDRAYMRRYRAATRREFQ